MSWIECYTMKRLRLEIPWHECQYSLRNSSANNLTPRMASRYTIMTGTFPRCRDRGTENTPYHRRSPWFLRTRAAGLYLRPWHSVEWDCPTQWICRVQRQWQSLLEPSPETSPEAWCLPWSLPLAPTSRPGPGQIRARIVSMHPPLYFCDIQFSEAWLLPFLSSDEIRFILCNVDNSSVTMPVEFSTKTDLQLKPANGLAQVKTMLNN